MKRDLVNLGRPHEPSLKGRSCFHFEDELGIIEQAKFDRLAEIGNRVRVHAT